MATTNPGASGAGSEGKGGAAAPSPFDIPALELDRSRQFSSVHGEHPLNLGFIQDHLPFDKGGRLLTAALKTPEFRHANDILKRKVARLTAEHQEAEENPVEDTGNQASPSAPIDDDPDADVNLVAWAKGKVKIQPFVIYRVARKRFAKDFRTIAAVKAFLIETKAVDANEVAN